MLNAKHTLIIAEAGVNHNGDLSTALDLIDAAVECGADIVKFQTFTATSLVTASAERAKYQKINAKDPTTQLEMLKALELDINEFQVLIDHCSKRNIEFCSSAFDAQSLGHLIAMGQKIIKIPSGEITNLPYLRSVGNYDFPTILSTGMSTLNEVENAVSALESAGLKKNNLTILHCNTQYPTPLRDVNLHAMQTIANHFGTEVGYSDHTEGIEVSIAAVSLGASVIEKHMTLDRSAAGPDHFASLEPQKFAEMVKYIRAVECALGTGLKEPSDSEFENIAIVRKSIVASKIIKKGEVFSEDNLTTKRPGNGISPMLWDEVVGQRASRDFLQDELIVT